MKKAILVVSFGTTYPEPMLETVSVMEQEIVEAFPGWEVRRAFSSDRIRQTLRQRDGIGIDSVTEAMNRLEAEGFSQVAVQCSYVTCGKEFEKLRTQLEPYHARMKIAVGLPLLGDAWDSEKTAQALLAWMPLLEEHEALILMGHGSRDSGNSDYVRMEQCLQEVCSRVYLATLTGDLSLDSVGEKLQKRPEIRKVMLAPFLLVAGKHACRDMAGSETSWETMLKAAGFEVRCVFRGIGQCPGVREIFVEHCRRAVEALCEGGNQ